MELPKKALGLTGLAGLAALATVGYALRSAHAAFAYPFWTLLVLTLATARMKVKLPGLTGNMAVSLPFLLTSVVELSLLEALLVALPSCAAQCFPKGGGKPKAIQLIFNVSTMAMAVAAANRVRAFGSNAVLLDATVFFLVQTIAVAAIVQATEGGAIHRIWSKMAHYSFPFYVLSAGVCMIVTSTVPGLGWQVPVWGVPVLYATYRSYETYFGALRGARA